jgi:tetratricopeptide (TPR) repeat protein
MFRRWSQTDFPAKIGTGLTLLQGGDRTGALQLFAEISHSNDPNVLRGLGLAYQQAGETQFAEHVIRRAVAGGSRDALNDLGVLLKRAGRPAEAEQALRQAADAGDPNAMNNLGNLFSERGDQQGATWFWHRAAEAGNARAMCSLGSYLASTGHPEARRWYDRAVAKLPEAPDIREQLDALAALVSGQGTGHAPPPAPTAPPDAPTQTTGPVAPGSMPANPMAPNYWVPPAATPAPAWSPVPPAPAPAPQTPVSGTPAPPGTPPSSTPPWPGTPGRYSPAPVTPVPVQAPPAPSWPPPPLAGLPPTPPPAAIGPWADDSADSGSGAQTSATVHRPRSSPPPASPPPAVSTLEPPTLIARAVLPTPPPDHAAAVDVPDTLRAAETLREEYLATGSPGKLGQALEASQLAADSVPAGDLATRGLVLGLRCALLRLAYQRDKDQTKLAESIEAGRAAKSLVRPSDPSFSRTLTSLASALREEYGRTRDPAILGEALALYRDGVHVLPEGHPELAGLQANICNVLMTQGLQDPRLLTEAVEAGRQAVALSDPDSAGYPTRLASLGMALVAHHANNQGPQSELDQAEQLFSRALATLPADHDLRPQIQGYVDAVTALRQRPA